jgi:hypothetical protein
MKKTMSTFYCLAERKQEHTNLRQQMMQMRWFGSRTRQRQSHSPTISRQISYPAFAAAAAADFITIVVLIIMSLLLTLDVTVAAEAVAESSSATATSSLADDNYRSHYKHAYDDDGFILKQEQQQEQQTFLMTMLVMLLLGYVICFFASCLAYISYQDDLILRDYRDNSIVVLGNVTSKTELTTKYGRQTSSSNRSTTPTWLCCQNQEQKQQKKQQQQQAKEYSVTVVYTIMLAENYPVKVWKQCCVYETDFVVVCDLQQKPDNDDESMKMILTAANQLTPKHVNISNHHNKHPMPLNGVSTRNDVDNGNNGDDKDGGMSCSSVTCTFDIDVPVEDVANRPSHIPTAKTETTQGNDLERNCHRLDDRHAQRVIPPHTFLGKSALYDSDRQQHEQPPAPQQQQQIEICVLKPRRYHLSGLPLQQIHRRLSTRYRCRTMMFVVGFMLIAIFCFYLAVNPLLHYQSMTETYDDDYNYYSYTDDDDWNTGTPIMTMGWIMFASFVFLSALQVPCLHCISPIRQSIRYSLEEDYYELNGGGEVIRGGLQCDDSTIATLTSSWTAAAGLGGGATAGIATAKTNNESEFAYNRFMEESSQ